MAVVSNITLCIGLHSVCTESNCCLSLYLNVGGLSEAPEKNVVTVLEKSWNFFSVTVWEACVNQFCFVQIKCCK